jgi:hypothetical protein
MLSSDVGNFQQVRIFTHTVTILMHMLAFVYLGNLRLIEKVY